MHIFFTYWVYKIFNLLCVSRLIGLTAQFLVFVLICLGLKLYKNKIIDSIALSICSLLDCQEAIIIPGDAIFLINYCFHS